MAKQTGVFKYTGKLGKTVSYTLNGKKVTRTIGEVDLEKMRTAPQYAETRKNQSEFAVATKAGQIFRQTMKHMTQGYTDYKYPMDVMSVMINTSRADDTQPKGYKQLNNGLRNPEAQMAFRRLNIYSKKSCRHFKGSLMQTTSDPMVYKLNRHLLWDKANDGDKKTVRLGYLHIDFEGCKATYEPSLSITCTRHETIQQSKHTLPTSNEEMAPWTFLIIQVWREGDVYEPARMMFMSVLDVIENRIGYSQGSENANNNTLHRDSLAKSGNHVAKDAIRKAVFYHDYGECVRSYIYFPSNNS
ncbi:MAG: hypothetical protein H7X99_00655 [Saprospiraceae bacterium]|nr:hypothetical protein [Saprospiraceae bacterium]